MTEGFDKVEVTSLISTGYVGDGYSQWSASSSGGECGLAYKMLPQPGTDQKTGVTWYAQTYGPVAIVHYSTERDISKGGAQYKWLKSTLEGFNRTQTPYVVAIGHRASYVDTRAAKDLDMQLYYQNLLDPLFTDNKVTAVFSGHTHVTQRHCASFKGVCKMKDTKGLYKNPQNPVFFSVGNAGAGSDLDGWTSGMLGFQYNAWWSARQAYTRVEIDGNIFKVTYVDAKNGDILDTSMIEIESAPACLDNAPKDSPAVKSEMSSAAVRTSCTMQAGLLSGMLALCLTLIYM